MGAGKERVNSDKTATNFDDIQNLMTLLLI